MKKIIEPSMTLEGTVQQNYAYLTTIEEMLEELREKNELLLNSVINTVGLDDEQMIDSYQKIVFCNSALSKIMERVKEISKTLEKERICNICDIIG